MGFRAGSNLTDSHNVVIGAEAANNMNHGAATGFMAVVGFQAGYYNVTGTSNSYLGYRAGFGVSGNSNSNNAAIGRESLYSVTTGSNNTVVGGPAGYNITSGSNNLMLGMDSGRSGSPGGAITTESNRIVLGDENITAIYAQVQTISASDERDKTDFVGTSVLSMVTRLLKIMT